MFHCRRNVSGASLFLQRLNFSGTLQLHSSGSRAMRCWRVYRGLNASKANVLLFRPCSREIPFGTSSGLVVARARMAAIVLNATPRREYSDILKSPNELESFLSVRSSSAAVMMMQTRRSATTPEKTRDERAANIQTVRHSYETDW